MLATHRVGGERAGHSEVPGPAQKYGHDKGATWHPSEAYLVSEWAAPTRQWPTTIYGVGCAHQAILRRLDGVAYHP